MKWTLVLAMMPWAASSQDYSYSVVPISPNEIPISVAINNAGQVAYLTTDMLTSRIRLYRDSVVLATDGNVLAGHQITLTPAHISIGPDGAVAFHAMTDGSQTERIFVVNGSGAAVGATATPPAVLWPFQHLGSLGLLYSLRNAAGTLNFFLGGTSRGTGEAYEYNSLGVIVYRDGSVIRTTGATPVQYTVPFTTGASINDAGQIAYTQAASEFSPAAYYIDGLPVLQNGQQFQGYTLQIGGPLIGAPPPAINNSSEILAGVGLGSAAVSLVTRSSIVFRVGQVVGGRTASQIVYPYLPNCLNDNNEVVLIAVLDGFPTIVRATPTRANPIDSGKVQGQTGTQGRPCAGNPCDIGSGNKFEVIDDYKTVGSNRLGFSRYYNSFASSDAASPMLGRNWRSTYDRYLRISSTEVLAERPDGRILRFRLNGSAWTTDSDVDVRLIQSSASTWVLTDVDDAVETYAAVSGSRAFITSIRARNGYQQNMVYNAANQLTSVSDSFNRSLIFTYHPGGRVRTITTPDGVVLTYEYDSSGSLPGVQDRLAAVTYPTTPITNTRYVYENPALPFALTAIIDENGNRFASWTYDSAGRVTTSQHAGGHGLTTIAYDDATGRRTVTNALGLQTVYEFTVLQGVPKMTRVTRLATPTTPAASRMLTYDVNGYVASETDWNGNLTTYVNDGRGRPIVMTEGTGTPQARTVTTTYHPIFSLPVRIVAPGVTTDLTYDNSGNLITRTLTDTTSHTVPYATAGTKRTWTYTWANGLLTSVKGPRTDLNQTTRFTYDASGTLVQTVNALGHVTRVTQHLPGGLPQRIVDPNNVVTTLAYDARLRLVTSTVQTPGVPLTTRYAYDPVGNLTGVTLPDGSAITNVYDAARRLTGIRNLLNQSIVYTLDALGNRTATNVLDAASAVKRTRAGSFDAIGRMIQDTGGAGQLNRFSYDGNGNPTSIINPLGRTTAQAFDSLNRRFRMTDPAGGVTTTVFDAQDRPLSVTAANGAVTSYVYNGFGDLIQTTSPDSGRTIYRYDLAGNLVQKTDARGVVANYAFDALDRLLTVRYAGSPDENITNTYDERGHGFGVGRLTSVSDAAGNLYIDYDERGNAIAESRVRRPATLRTICRYDAANRVAAITYPSGLVVTYARDVVGQVTGIAAQRPRGPARAILSSISYLPYGPAASMSFGNGVAGSRSFDLDYRLTNLTDASVLNLTYGYDAGDNVRSIADAVRPAYSQSFGYDLLDRLTNAAGGYGLLAYTYDSVGNRLTQQMGAVASVYSYLPQSNRVTQVQTGSVVAPVVYDPAGNITAYADAPSSVETTALSYNRAGRLERAIIPTTRAFTQFGYDAFGQRIVKIGSSTAVTLFQYDRGGRLLEEADAAGRAIVDYVYLGDTPVAAIGYDGQISFLHADRLGTPQRATGTNQAVVWAADYQPFGATGTGLGLIVQNLRLPGQEFEVETRLHHNGFRDYIPGWGRYLQSDPIGLAGGVNTYTYVGNSPIRYLDPDGLRARPPFRHEAPYPRHTPPQRMRQQMTPIVHLSVSRGREIIHAASETIEIADEWESFNEDLRELQVAICVGSAAQTAGRQAGASDPEDHGLVPSCTVDNPAGSIYKKNRKPVFVSEPTPPRTLCEYILQNDPTVWKGLLRR